MVFGAGQFALMLENARLTDRMVEQEKVNRDVQLAAEVQKVTVNYSGGDTPEQLTSGQVSEAFFRLWGASVPMQTLWIIAITAVFMVLTHLFFEHTIVGKALRAVVVSGAVKRGESSSASQARASGGYSGRARS